MIQNAGTWRLVNYSDFSWFIRIDRKVENLDILGMLALISLYLSVYITPSPGKETHPLLEWAWEQWECLLWNPKNMADLSYQLPTHSFFGASDVLVDTSDTSKNQSKTILRIWALSWTQRNGGKDSPLATWRKHGAYGDYATLKKATHCNPIAILHEIKWNPSACEVHKISDPSKWETANFGRGPEIGYPTRHLNCVHAGEVQTVLGCLFGTQGVH